MSSLRLAVTADLHWGSHATGDAATRQLVRFLHNRPPDGLVLAGDIGAAQHFAPCLELFADLPGWKALVPGNHDVWVAAHDPRGDSLAVYETHLPALCRTHRFHYLDHAPLLLPDAGLAVVGSMNWYDYSWAIDRLPAAAPDWEERLRSKVFTRGRHNDARFVRWPFDDAGFTARAVAAFGRHLDQALAAVERAVVVTHHPPYRALSFPRAGPPTLDGLLWEAFSGNRAMEEVLELHSERVALTFCGHTHRARAGDLGPIRGFNIGGDYHFKRLLLVDWPEGTVEEHTFGDP